jgi:hypothetical protein
MRIYRGPSTKSFYDDTHEFVARISPKALEAGVREKANIQFNITKNGTKREAVCTAVVEEADLIPMASGLLARLTLQQECLRKIKEIMSDKSSSDEEKVKAIQTALSAI